MNIVDSQNRGLSAYVYFHNEALNFPDNYSMDLPSVQALITGLSPNFFQLFGNAVVQSGLDEPTIQTKMVALADTNQGLLPSHLSEFLKTVDPVNLDAGTMTWTTTIKAVAEGVGAAAVQGVQAAAVVGQAGISGITSTLKFLPLLLGIGIAIYAFSKGGGVLPAIK